MTRTRLGVMLLSLAFSSTLLADNTKETVEQVVQTVTLTADVDYIVTSATPFADGGVVNIANTNHAVLILAGVKPSKALSLIGGHVQVNGAKAQNDVNCQVKLYNRGTIILPYDKAIKPLTVFSEPRFQGESCNDFGLENSGGFMNTLTDDKLNNRIRSFKLKRGYMVTFSLRAGGRGYSRCFIAADKDIEMATLPAILDRSISSYRIFKWYDTGKQQLAASGGDNAVCSALNVTSTYTWGTTGDMSPDIENVPHHIYENYPSPAALGACTTSPHMKTNNEPMNTADDPKGKTESVDQVLANWEDLMATGMRLCSPSSWDGSDYWNGTGYLKQFMDSIDARGWRCDILDMHCYWPEGNFGAHLPNWSNSCGRPVWISEWVWGASWNQNGAFANGVTEHENAEAVRRICEKLNSLDFVERYYYWNFERDPSRLYKDGQLTEAGSYYATINSGLGYNPDREYVPAVPPMNAPSNFTVSYDKEKHEACLSWFEPNGEANEYMRVERRKNEQDDWTLLADIVLAETGRQYSYTDLEAEPGWQYRVKVQDALGKLHVTQAVMAVIEHLEVGDAVSIGGKTMYLGGNIFLNGAFDYGTYGWTDGKGNTISSPWFQVVPVGGFGGGAYLQCYGNGQVNTESALRTAVDVAPDSYYYFSGVACNTVNRYCRLELKSEHGDAADTIVATLINEDPVWRTQFAVFSTGRHNKALVSFRLLGAKSQFDNLALCRLFTTKEEAMADGSEVEQRRTAVTELFNKQKYLDQLTQCCEDASFLAERYFFPGREKVTTACTEAKQLLATPESCTALQVANALEALQDALDEFLPLTAVTDKIKSPKFLASTGWQTKAGTYQGGDQRLNIQDGITFWNAWWALTPEGNNHQTMAIRQTVSGLSHGLYAVECKAATEHFCLSDQHAYVSNGTDSLTTPVLTADYMDLPTTNAADRWQTLSSLPVYVDEDGSLIIGFESSKRGASDLAWHRLGDTSGKGDHREGWWGATDFSLKFHPLYRVATVPGTILAACLPYAVAPSPGVDFFEIAAITSDYRNVCLQPVDEVSAGVPFLYRSNSAEASFMEHGEAVTTTTDGPGNLRGFLKTRSASLKVPEKHYMLVNGVWQKIGADRPSRPSFSAFIRPFNDPLSKPVAVVESWDGITMPIEGVTEEEMLTAIRSLAVPDGAATPGYFTLSGQKIAKDRVAPGIYIRVLNGKGIKAIIR